MVLPSGQQTTVEELQAYCKQQLAGYKVPKEIQFRTSLPKSTVGGVLRRELRRAESERQAAWVAEAGIWHPRRLTGLWGGSQQ